MKFSYQTLALVLLAAAYCAAADEPKAEPAKNRYAAWKNGLPADADFFPIAVWLQEPANAPKYQAAGINLYVGLWKGPNEAQLAELKKHDMKVICAQNGFALKHLDDPTIAGWMHGDEPDNAQSLKDGKGYGPPILPAKIVEDYQRIQNADPTRPIMVQVTVPETSQDSMDTGSGLPSLGAEYR
jgi:hypothetical protein